MLFVPFFCISTLQSTQFIRLLYSGRDFLREPWCVRQFSLKSQLRELILAFIVEWIVVIWIKSIYYFGLLQSESLSCIDEIITRMCLELGLRRIFFNGFRHWGKLHSNEKLVWIRKRLPLEELVMGFGPESTPARRVGSLAVVTSLLAGSKDDSNSEAFTSDDFSNSANRLEDVSVGKAVHWRKYR